MLSAPLMETGGAMAGVSLRATGFPVGGVCDPVPGAAPIPSGDRASSPERFAPLLATIEREVIPRLLLAHRVEQAGKLATAATLDAAEIEELARLLIREGSDAAAGYVQQVRARGVALETILLDLLAPAARLLGRWWERDECDFTAVTIGLWRLQRILYEVGPCLQGGAAPQADGRRILLSPTPHEQHTFGLLLVGELFRRDGWEVVAGPSFSHEELVRLVREQWFIAFGLSLAAERWFDAAAAVIRDVRRTSHNRAIVIIVGGAFFVEHPDQAARIGADGSAADARQAVRLARRLVAAQFGRTPAMR